MARIKIGNIKGPAGPKGATGATGPIGPVGPQGPLPPLANNFLATVAGKSALDAVAGKTLKDQLDQQNSDIGKINTWLLNGQLYLEERNYTTLNIDGTTYTGSTTVLWIRITNAAKNRQMLLGKMISSNAGNLYTDFVSGSKILVQSVTDSTWGSIRSL